MLEEVETNVTIDKELAVVENFYTDKNNLLTHDISFYYIVKGELKQHNFVWLDIINLLKNFDYRPSFIKEKVTNNNFDFEHIIIK